MIKSFAEIKAKEETDDWVYYPNLFGYIDFNEILTELKAHCATYINIVNGKEYESKRMSCVIGKSTYGKIPHLKWEKVDIINDIRKYLDEVIMPNFATCDYSCSDDSKSGMINYVLAHIYRTGTDYISYHNDKEALYTPVISMTFAPKGVTRKFRFRKIGDKSGYVKEFQLGHGDLLIMKAGCQRKYTHSVPVEKTITQSRINLTFRY